MGTQAFATETNNGNHYGWEIGTNNPHKSEVTPPEVEIENPTENTVSLEEINAIINDLNHSELSQFSIVTRYENGWIKMDNIVFDYVPFEWEMSIVNRVLDNYNVKQVGYMSENVIWDQGSDGTIGTGHWGTVGIKVVKK